MRADAGNAKGASVARFLVFGTIAWDEPIRLYSALRSGGRMLGETLPARLGGGGANAGAALANAGHEVAVAAGVAEDARGEALLAEAARAGIDLRFVSRGPAKSMRTLIFLEPNGERAILGLDWRPPSPEAPRPQPITRELVEAYAPDGIFLRSASAGVGLAVQGFAGPILAHWPFALESGAAADVLIASRDDVGEAPGGDPLAWAKAKLGHRCAFAVITDGAHGAQAFGEAGVLHQPADPARVVDTTGAGDIFAAGLLEALVAGAGMAQALAHASAWGKAAVECEGSAPLGAPPGTFPAFGRTRPRNEA